MEKRPPTIHATCLLALTIIFLAPFASAEYFDLKWNQSTKGIVTATYIADLNGDGFEEVIASSSESSLGGSNGWVYVLDREGNIKWKKETKGAITRLIIADIDNDKKNEVLAGVSYAVYIFDETGGYQKILLSEHQYKVSDMTVTDLDGDHVKELVVAGSSSKDGKVFIFYNQTGWERSSRNSMSTAVHAADIDGDGELEIIAGTGEKFDDYPGTVYAVDKVGNLIWEQDTETTVLTISSGDIDNDGGLEVIVGCKDFIYVYEGNGTLKGSYSYKGYNKNMVICDLEGDGKKEIITGSGTIYVLDSGFDKIWQKSLDPSAYINRDIFQLTDVNGDGVQEIIAAADKIYLLDSRGNELGTYKHDNDMFFAKNLAMGDLDRDDYPEIAFGSRDGNVYMLWSQVQRDLLDAESLYSQAKKLYSSGDYDGAKEKAKEAERIFKEVNNADGARKVGDLLLKIENAGDQVQAARERAEENYAIAAEAFTARDYLNATKYARIARNIYQSPLEDTEKVASCNMIMDGSGEMIRSNAEEYLRNASECLSGGNYERALYFARLAEEYYAFLKDDEGLNKSRELIAGSGGINGSADQGDQREGQGTGSMSVSTQTILKGFIALAVLLLIGLVANLVIKRKRNAESMDAREVFTETAKAHPKRSEAFARADKKKHQADETEIDAEPEPVEHSGDIAREDDRITEGEVNTKSRGDEIETLQIGAGAAGEPSDAMPAEAPGDTEARKSEHPRKETARIDRHQEEKLSADREPGIEISGKETSNDPEETSTGLFRRSRKQIPKISRDDYVGEGHGLGGL